MLVRGQVHSTTGIPRAVSSIKLLDVLLKILSTWDLETTTAGRVRRHLEKDFGADLSDPKYRIIKEKIDVFFEDGEEDENEGKGRGRRKRKRKRKEKEICIVSPQLQDIVGEGPEMARAKAVKKIVAYGREKGLHKNKSIIYIDDKLEAPFPGRRSIHIFRIDNLLAKNSHIQPLKAGKDERGVRKTNDEAICKKSENCEGDQDRVKKKGKNVTEEDVRPWDKMPQAIMVKIFKLLPFPDWSFHPCYVCSSWQVAVADVMFPPENRELNLLVLDSYPWIFRQKWFFKYLRIALNPPSAICWTTLYLPRTAFIKNDILTEIAEKTPELRKLYVPQKLWEDVLLKSVAPKWKNLTRVHIYFGYHQFF
ncbi:hypothetical protein ABKV19_006893 [Rosa sericea]